MILLHSLMKSFLASLSWRIWYSFSNNLLCISKILYKSVFKNLYVYLKQFVFVVENDKSRQCWAPISFYVPRHNNLIVQLPKIKRNQNPNTKEKEKVEMFFKMCEYYLSNFIYFYHDTTLLSIICTLGSSQPFGPLGHSICHPNTDHSETVIPSRKDLLDVTLVGQWRRTDSPKQYLRCWDLLKFPYKQTHTHTYILVDIISSLYSWDYIAHIMGENPWQWIFPPIFAANDRPPAGPAVSYSQKT